MTLKECAAVAAPSGVGGHGAAFAAGFAPVEADSFGVFAHSSRRQNEVVGLGVGELQFAQFVFDIIGGFDDLVARQVVKRPGVWCAVRFSDKSLKLGRRCKGWLDGCDDVCVGHVDVSNGAYTHPILNPAYTHPRRKVDGDA